MSDRQLPEHLSALIAPKGVSCLPNCSLCRKRAKLRAILAAAQAVVNKGPYQFSTRNPHDTYLRELKEALADD